MLADADRINEIQRLNDENQRLKTELAQKNDQLAEQAATIATLRGLEGDRSLDRVVHVAGIRIDRLSGGYDDNRDGIDDGVVVYVLPVDQFGGPMRASGSAGVTILNLTQANKPSVILDRNFSVDELGQMWYGTFLSSHYTIKLPWESGGSDAAVDRVTPAGQRGASSGVSPARPPAREITVVVTFTDLLTGSVHTAQQVVKVTGYAESANQP
ncbi:MAG: hypothetical protein KF841_10660 [Phycisphaerae bacterium]|nr:hypothetical protein [Phycisphaerae bacterium]